MAAALDDDELGAGEVGEGAAPVDVLAHVPVAVDHERRHGEVRGTAPRSDRESGEVELLRPPRWRRGSRRSTPSPTPTASSHCFVECGSTSCSPKKNSTQRRWSVRDHVAVEQLPPDRIVEALVPGGGGRDPVRLRRAEVRHAGGDGDQRDDALGVGGDEVDRPPVRRGSGRRPPPARWPVASRTATMSATLAARVWSPTAVGRPDRPLPRPSNVTTR